MNPYVKLAKKAITEYVKNNKTISPSQDLDKKLLNEKAGVFVSIHNPIFVKTVSDKKEDLRGCIGTFAPTKENVAQEIISNAIAACSRDYRFTPITKDELEDLKISVDILSAPEKIDDITILNPKKYGVLIKSKIDERSGLLLPNLKDVDVIHDQLAIVLNKASLTKNDPVDIYRFTVKRYE